MNTDNESIEREGYEHSNSLHQCFVCGTRLETRESIILGEPLLFCPTCFAFILEDESDPCESV